jgi:hypothetical protein
LRNEDAERTRTGVLWVNAGKHQLSHARSQSH